MPKASPAQCFATEEPHLPHYTSFILRCWFSDTGQLRARLIDVQSGASHLVKDWADLPELVRCLAETDLAGHKE